MGSVLCEIGMGNQPGKPILVRMAVYFREVHMTEDKVRDSKPDRTRINVNEAHERRDWAAKFGISEGKLRDIVVKVGSRAKDVAAALGKKL
jgi:hypothetical protein